jgi:hypothetical protein
LFDRSKETEYYLVMWIEASIRQNNDLHSSDITRIKALLIKRDTLLDHLRSEGFDEKSTNEKQKEIIRNGKGGRLYQNEHNHISYYYTTHLTEKPINLLVYRRKLEHLSEQAYFITRQGVEIVKTLYTK